MGKGRGCVLFCGLLALLLCTGGLLAFLLHTRDSDLPKDGHWSEGRYLKGKYADFIIFSDEAYSMGKADETVSFEGLTDGDLIRVYINWIGLTFPGQTVVYAVEKLEDGAFEDIPVKELELLREYGHLEEQGLPAEGSWITGRYLKGKNSDLIVDGEWNVISMGAADETVSFENFEDGDLIRVYIDYILETWPGQTTVCAVEKADGEEIQEISPELMEELREMGWIE